MNKSTILNLVLAIAVVALVVKLAMTKSSADADNATAPADSTVIADAAINNIMTRTSIRAYQNRPVSDGVVDTLLRAAMAAPTARNSQPWRFVVVRDRAKLDSLAALPHPMKMMETAQVAIVVCGDMDSALEGDGRDFWIQDASAATENLLLAAHAKGLGAVWCGGYPIADRVDLFRSMFHLPDNIIPLDIVAIGYPAEDPAPKDKYEASHIHHETW